MADYETILVEQRGAVTLITLNRPQALNALNSQVLEDLIGAFADFEADEKQLCAVLTGSGDKAFAAGADIKEMSEKSAAEFYLEDFFAKWTSDIVKTTRKPWIAAVNGFALGGGCELAMACHIRVAVKGAKFGQPEVSLGIIPGYGGTQRLTQLIGKGKATELLMTGDMISAQKAKKWGLVNHVVDSKASLMEKCEEILEKITSKAPLAVGMIVTCLNAFYTHDENGFQTEANSFASCCKSEDFKEGTDAFLEKRKPVFGGE